MMMMTMMCILLSVFCHILYTKQKKDVVLQDYAQCRFDAYFKQKKLFSWLDAVNSFDWRFHITGTICRFYKGPILFFPQPWYLPRNEEMNVNIAYFSIFHLSGIIYTFTRYILH